MTSSTVNSWVLPQVLEPQTALRLARLATPLLSDALDRLNGLSGLERFNRAGKLVGVALTVKTRPGDNLGMYHAMTLMQPGHVLVVDGGGDMNNALCGDLMRTYAISKGCAGFVVDGAIRDVASFESGEFPCYARGVVHRGPYKSGPARIGETVSVGGQAIANGDVIVGDEDGVVAFPLNRLDEVIAAAEKKLTAENGVLEEIASGATRQTWLHGALAELSII